MFFSERFHFFFLADGVVPSYLFKNQLINKLLFNLYLKSYDTRLEGIFLLMYLYFIVYVYCVSIYLRASQDLITINECLLPTYIVIGYYEHSALEHYTIVI